MTVVQYKADPTEYPNADDRAAVDVAIDIMEQSSYHTKLAAELQEQAVKLLDEQAPRRLNRKCPVCGAFYGKPCFELVEKEATTDYGVSFAGRSHVRNEMRRVYRVVPHHSRLI